MPSTGATKQEVAFRPHGPPRPATSQSFGMPRKPIYVFCQIFAGDSPATRGSKVTGSRFRRTGGIRRPGKTLIS